MAVVLTVDDDSDDLDLLEEAILEIDSEIKLFKASDGLEALSLLKPLALTTYSWISICQS